MKTPSLSIAACVTAILVLSADAQLPCDDLGPGRACTNYLGEESRCSQPLSCLTGLEECSSDAKLLHTCSMPVGLKFCYPMFGEGKPMQCMEPKNIDTLVKRDQCSDKSDGTPCKSAYTEADGNTGKTAAVYEEEGTCEDGYCLSTFFTACNDVMLGATCTAKGVLSGTLRQFRGMCMDRTPFRPRCNVITDKGIFLRSATVLIGSAPISITETPSGTPAPTTAAPPKTSAPTSAMTSSISGENVGADSSNSDIASLYTMPPLPPLYTTAPIPPLYISSSERPLASVAVCTAALLSVSFVLVVV